VKARVLLESCVDSLDAAIASECGGAARIELCADLDVGGTTPDADLISCCADRIAIPIVVMVRPRGGDFVYDAGEVNAMERAIRTAAASGARGIVCGALGRDGVIDATVMRRLVDAARPLPVTCHRAIDATRNLGEALDALLALGVDRVLTSGGAPTAAEGAETIAKLVVQAGDALVVMAGGTVRVHNVADLVRRTHVREVHARLTDPKPALSDDRRIVVWQTAVSDFVGALRPGS
jgi:copper homeostasis protein